MPWRRQLPGWEFWRVNPLKQKSFTPKLTGQSRSIPQSNLTSTTTASPTSVSRTHLSKPTLAPLAGCYASALFAGARVGPKGQFLPAQGLMAATSFLGGARRQAQSTCSGPWANVSNRYLGLKFVITGKVHFGWARLNVSCSTKNRVVTALLTGYAYETVPDQPIIAGREKGSEDISQEIRTSPRPFALGPASLGRLARGAAGLTAGHEKQ